MSARKPRRPGGVALGIVLLARGRADGMAEFADGRQAFLASLAPLLAFPIVGLVLLLAQGGGLGAATDFLATLCALLAPPVLSWQLAAHWRREARWMRFATAFNWCQWAVPVVAALLILAVSAVVAGGVPVRVAGAAAMGALVCYGLWLHWFLARHGLDLSRGRAAALVLLVNVGTVALVLVPQLVQMWSEGKLK